MAIDEAMPFWSALDVDRYDLRTWIAFANLQPQASRLSESEPLATLLACGQASPKKG